jgi:hypothetical protein
VPGLLIYGIYVAAVYGLLLLPRYAAEFGQEGLSWLQQQPGTAAPAARPRLVMLLAVGCAVSSILAVVFAVLYFTRSATEKEFKQGGVVQVGQLGKEGEGVVTYSIPFMRNPKLTLFSLHGSTAAIISQNKFGFRWRSGQVGEFNWEAVGAVEAGSQTPQRRNEKTTTGKFMSRSGEGAQAFGIKYAHPPQVELKNRSAHDNPARVTILVDVTTEGFKWKNVGKKDDPADNGEVTWTASGQIDGE